MKAKIEELLHQKNPLYSPSRMEIVYTNAEKQLAIFKYETYDYETGKGSKSYLYSICDFYGEEVYNYSYEDLELCIRVIEANAVKDPTRILALLKNYNLEKRE